MEGLEARLQPAASPALAGSSQYKPHLAWLIRKPHLTRTRNEGLSRTFAFTRIAVLKDKEQEKCQVNQEAKEVKLLISAL